MSAARKRYVDKNALARSKEWYYANRERISAAHKAKHETAVSRIWGRPRPTRCELCNGDNGGRTLNADHDHRTGQPRLFLCIHCNRILGIVEKERSRVQFAIAYLGRDKEAAKPHFVSLGAIARPDYPTSSVANENDVAWIRKTLESASRSKKSYKCKK